MHTLPPAMTLLLRSFAPLFSRRVWAHVQVLLTGADPRPRPTHRDCRPAGDGLGGISPFPTRSSRAEPRSLVVARR